MWLTPVATASTADKSMTPLCEGASSDMAPEPRETAFVAPNIEDNRRRRRPNWATGYASVLWPGVIAPFCCMDL
jgi:hypothetical protein